LIDIINNITGGIIDFSITDNEVSSAILINLYVIVRA